MVSGSALISLLITVGIVFFFCWGAWWFITHIQLREPFLTAAKVFMVIVVLIVFVYLIFGIGGTPLIRWR